MSSEIAIRVEGLSKCFQIYARPRDRLKQMLLPRLRRMLGLNAKAYSREFWALNGVSFEIRRGETVGIIGRNGSGKSTLLQMICGTLNPTAGTVQTNGRIAALLELGSGFNPEFTGRENVYMNASLLGLKPQEIDARYSDIVAFADIGDFISQPVKTYSSGMMVRLAFAVIAHVDADILVVDEALAVGDAFFTQKCMRFLRDFMVEHSVIFVSHDTSAVINLCSHAIWLEKGIVMQAGSPKDVSEKYLEKQYQETLGSLPAAQLNAPISATDVGEIRPEGNDDYRDMRLDYLNQTTLRNDIQVLRFNADSYSYGSGLGKIVSATLNDTQGKQLAWVLGGERVGLAIMVQLAENLDQMLFGFSVKDALGQVLFGDNSYLSHARSPVSGQRGDVWKMEFTFRMPVLPVGDYTVDLTFGSGTQDEHVIHHWIRDGFAFKSHASSAHTGLIGIPMISIVAQQITANTNIKN